MAGSSKRWRRRVVEFGSAVDAVECAIEIQRAMAERNAQSRRRPIQFRIGMTSVTS